MTAEEEYAEPNPEQEAPLSPDIRDRSIEPEPLRAGRAFISDGQGLTLLEEVPWNSRNLRALLSLALSQEALTDAGTFAVVRSRTGEGYTARPIRTPAQPLSPLLRVTRCEGHWIAVGPAGSEPREIFADGSSQPWEGPVPVDALI